MMHLCVTLYTYWMLLNISMVESVILSLRDVRHVCQRCLRPALYCIVFIHFYSASHSLSLSEALPTTAIHLSIHLYSTSCSARLSEALPVRETQREESIRPWIV